MCLLWFRRYGFVYGPVFVTRDVYEFVCRLEASVLCLGLCVCVSLCHLSVSVCISKFLNNSVCSGVSEFWGIWVCVCVRVYCVWLSVSVYFSVSSCVCIQDI